MERGSLELSIVKFGHFDLDGGHLALDFTNTIEWRYTAKEHEWFKEYTDLVGWGMRVGITDKFSAEDLVRKARQNSATAQDVLLRARDLRELLFRVFTAVVEKRSPDPEDWQDFNRAVRKAMGSAGIEQTHGRFFWSFRQDANRLDFFMGPVLKASTDLLIAGDLSRLKRCDTPDCQWLFLDTSKNNSRRWCDMQSCGNRAKAKRYYRKTRQSPRKG